MTAELTQYDLVQVSLQFGVPRSSLRIQTQSLQSTSAVTSIFCQFTDWSCRSVKPSSTSSAHLSSNMQVRWQLFQEQTEGLSNWRRLTLGSSG